MNTSSFGSSCAYCSSRRTKTCYVGEFHKVDRSFGPFTLFECEACGSFGTQNIPSAKRLAAFYRDYDQHRPEWYNKAAETSALDEQYDFYARHVASFIPGHAPANWLDLGAGHGEVANLLRRIRPNATGTALDITERPPGLDPSLSYFSCDINADDPPTKLGPFDFVYSIAVWEHVVSPINFARNALSLLSLTGTLVLVCPDYGSLARRALGRRWPYFEPGEHLSMPTATGARACIDRAAAELGLLRSDYAVESRPLWTGYSIRYVLYVLRLEAIATLMPRGISAPLPTGLLATTVHLKAPQGVTLTRHRPGAGSLRRDPDHSHAANDQDRTNDERRNE
jgi:SAM-dependent methyltransferase